jgi:4-diphosphocytidyl-2-C-methyl-D-erythritol kinase
MNPLTLLAPAKLNLSLRVLAKRNDGFHDIDTLMVKLPGLADILEFTPAEKFSFTCDDSTIPIGETNLVARAVRAYEAASQTPCQCTIHLRKVIPHGAGLGGGSSDAATTLLGLNRLNSFKLNFKQLHEIADSIGSDIPFFLVAGAARCTGRGEQIQAVVSPPALPVLLLKPSFAVPTVDAYKRWKRSFEIPGIHYTPQPVGKILLENDLERPVFEKHRFLAEMKQWLLGRSETSAALMSGSGSTLFAVLHDLSAADSLATAARQELDPHLWHWSGTTEG